MEGAWGVKRQMEKLVCKLCGGRLGSRSVKDMMEHLQYSHYGEFVDRVEELFFWTEGVKKK